MNFQDTSPFQQLIIIQSMQSVAAFKADSAWTKLRMRFLGKYREHVRNVRLQLKDKSAHRIYVVLRTAQELNTIVDGMRQISKLLHADSLQESGDIYYTAAAAADRFDPYYAESSTAPLPAKERDYDELIQISDTFEGLVSSCFKECANDLVSELTTEAENLASATRYQSVGELGRMLFDLTSPFGGPAQLLTVILNLLGSNVQRPSIPPTETLQQLLPIANFAWNAMGSKGSEPSQSGSDNNKSS